MVLPSYLPRSPIAAGLSVATLAQAQAGTDNTTVMTPLQVQNAIAHFFANLPTTQPSTPNTLWWDGGVLATT